MKFAEKIIWSCLLTLAILFSIGSAIMIYQNHQNLLHTTIHQYLSIQDTELYSLETRLYQDSISRESYFDDKYLMNRAIYYVGQFQHITQTKKTYALSLPDKTIFYNNIDEAFQEYISIDNNQKYFIKHKNNQYKMIVTSKINMRENSFYLTSCYDLTSVYQDRQRQIGNFLVTSVVLFSIAYFILKFLSSYLTQSIHKLNEVSQRIADGNYSERTHITSEDEIGELSKSFDEMAEMNEKKIHQLEDSVIQKEEFMGSFSHEVKTPMTAILGFADLLRTCDCDEQTRQIAAQYIYTEGKRLEKLSYTLMDLLALGDNEIELQDVSLKIIMKQLEDYYQGQSLHYSLKFENCDKYVKAQPDLLFTLLRNLIDNAMKASEIDQPIIITTDIKDQHVIISVKDQGIGMSEEDVKKATDAFYMADKSRSRSMGGAGLGLTIVKRICDAHHTKLLIQSKLNQGTTVSFELEVAYHE